MKNHAPQEPVGTLGSNRPQGHADEEGSAEPGLLLRRYAHEAAADLEIPVAQVNLLRLAYWLARRKGTLQAEEAAP